MTRSIRTTPLPRTLETPARALLLLALASACGSPEGDEQGSETGASGETGQPVETGDGDALTWWRDVAPIVEAKCGKCHKDGGIAPFSLETHAAFTTFAASLVPAIESRDMPPWLASDDCNEYSHSRALSDEQRETLLAYLDGDMLAGDPADAPPDSGPPERVLDADVVLTMPESYTANDASADDYRCFLIPWPADIQEPRFVTGLDVQPGEPRVVHHVIVFAVAENNLGSYADRDAADPGPGYTCFGGPGPTDGSARWVGAWVPGMAPFFAPDGVGQQIDPGTTLVMQVHYHPIGMPLSDRSSIALETAASVERRAEILPLADLEWLKSDGSMLIPAGDANATHEVSVTHSDFLVSNIVVNRLGLAPDADLELINAGLHMHTFGTHARVEVREPDGGDPQCVLDIPRWDFNWQSSYDLVQPLRFRAGQQLHVQCWWDNSAANQPIVGGKRKAPADIDWGEGTLDEMCLGILYLTSTQS